MTDSTQWGEVTALRARSGRIYARIVLANVVGAALVAAEGVVVSRPATGPNRVGTDSLISIAVLMAYLAVAVPVDILVSRRRADRAYGWVDDRRPPTPEEQAATLRYPWAQAIDIFSWWVGGALLFGGLNLVAFGNSVAYSLRATIATGLGGLTTASLCYLLLERVNRPVWALALAGEAPARSQAIGLERRLVLSWALGAGVPLIVIGTAPVGLTARQRAALGVPLLVVLGIGLALGYLVTRGAARGVASPLGALRQAQQRVEAGDLDVNVTVDDGGEVGQLQAGFNRMVAGLRERQRLQDLFGRHVGVEVARQALDRGAQLGGEVRHASVLFVDLIGSTSLALRLPPDQVVAMLNDVFAAVVRVTASESGWVNKFEGDAALCVFGPPGGDPDHAAHALRAARALRDELREVSRRHPGVDAGIGVSSGLVVAGNVGAEDRYEYTVIGDPVNEAARLTEAAKQDPTRLLVAVETVKAAGDEACNWERWGSVVLRGRSQETEVYAPANRPAPTPSAGQAHR